MFLPPGKPRCSPAALAAMTGATARLKTAVATLTPVSVSAKGRDSAEWVFPSSAALAVGKNTYNASCNPW